MSNKKSRFFNPGLEIILTGVTLLIITWLHFRWTNAPLSYHATLQFLYYLPIIYAAVRFGLPGGVITALVTTLLYVSHLSSLQASTVYINHPLQIGLINLMGLVAGTLSYSEKKVSKRYLELATKQEELIHKLEQSNKTVAKTNLSLQREIAEREALEDSLRRTERLSAMGHLAAGVAHEMRNPLGIIRATMQILEQEHKELTAVKECSGVIIEECDRMNAVIQEFLKFARPAEPKFEGVKLQDVLDDVLLLTAKYLQREGIEVHRSNHPADDTVWADPGQLKQVLINLIINAVEAMPKGGRLEIVVRAEGITQEISLIDSGQGMSAEVLSQIFDPFFSTKPRGTGLGLSMVHRILENHNGSIRVDSEEGRGTKFTITLPKAGEDSVTHSSGG